MYPNVEGMLTDTKPVNDREPLIGLERGTGIILQVDPFQHEKHGFSARARILVHESTGVEAHAAGSVVCAIWMIERRTEYPGQTSDKDRFADFLAKLCDSTDKVKNAQLGGAVLVHRVPDQLLRGMVIKFEGVGSISRGKGVPAIRLSCNSSSDEIRSLSAQYNKSPFVAPMWSTVQQTAEQVTAWRRSLDQSHPVQVRQAQQMQAPQGYGYGQPAVAYPNAPHAAAQPQYAPPQYGQPQAAQPQGYAPGYAPAPQQVAPAPAYAQPQAAPQQQAQPQTQAANTGYPVPPGYGQR